MNGYAVVKTDAVTFVEDQPARSSLAIRMGNDGSSYFLTSTANECVQLSWQIWNALIDLGWERDCPAPKRIALQRVELALGEEDMDW